MNAYLRANSREFIEEVSADSPYGRQQFVQDVKELQRNAASQGASAERRTVHARSDGRSRSFIGDDDAERQAAGERLGGNHDIGKNRGIDQLIAEPGSWAPNPALDLVEHEQRVVPVGEFARLGGVFACNREDAAFALDPLDDNARPCAP